MEMIKYGKTKQFSDVIRDIRHHARYVGFNEETNEPIFDNSIEYPIIEFTGTAKLHGTNASVCWNGEKMWVQTRNNIVEGKVGHMGFAEFVWMHELEFKSMLELNHIEGCTTTIYGEWVGDGIQKGVAVSMFDKPMFFVFAVKITPPEGDAYWLKNWELPIMWSPTSLRIWDIRRYLNIKLNIDIGNPEAVQNQLINYTMEVEKQCPVGKAFGIEGVGEGIVWEGWFKDTRYVFKVKGDKHSSSKVTRLAAVNPEKIRNIMEFVDYAVTPNRVKQAIHEVTQVEGIELDKKHTPHILRWIANDIISEEGDTLLSNDLEWKDISKLATDQARRMFFDYLNKITI